MDVYAWNEIYSVANTQISAGNSPDILNLDDFKTYQSDGMLLSADKFLSSKTYDKFYDVHLNAATVQGKVWAIPDLTSTSALYYNKELLKGAGVSVPTTWNGVLKACKALKETYGNDIIPWGVATAYENRIETAANYIWSNGGDFLDSNGCWNVNSDANVEALYYAAALYQEDYAGYLYTHNYELMDAFRAGDVAMMIGSDTFRYSMENGFYGISKIPANTGKIASAPVVMDYFMCFDNNQTDKEMSAIKKIL